VQRTVKALERLGPYELLAPLGEGGMGEVWKARDTRLDRIVALKFSKARFEERFQHEAHAVAALNHPHIAALYDVGPDYLVMEFVEGSPLRGPLPIGKAVAYASQILDALEAAHRKGIVHRDLKPANILVTPQGIKLLDFGLAKRQPLGPVGDATLTKALTEEGQIVGTLQYMAPEQLQGRPADARSDIFSFGCVLYEMLTGRCAFDGPSKASVIAAILEREPAPLAVDPPLERVVRTCLAKDPEDRFHNAADLKRSLLWAAEAHPPVAAQPRRNPLLMSALAGACLMLALALAWTLFRPSQTNSPGAAKLSRVTQDGQSYSPALSPDGKLVAYASGRSGSANGEIYLQQLSGEGTVRLTDHPAMDVYPEFSADGSKSSARTDPRSTSFPRASPQGSTKFLHSGVTRGCWLQMQAPLSRRLMEDGSRTGLGTGFLSGPSPRAKVG
jgi:eukaryotic-like serine/threonine-protein kinase